MKRLTDVAHEESGLSEDDAVKELEQHAADYDTLDVAHAAEHDDGEGHLAGALQRRLQRRLSGLDVAEALGRIGRLDPERHQPAGRLLHEGGREAVLAHPNRHGLIAHRSVVPQGPARGLQLPLEFLVRDADVPLLPWRR